MNKLRRLILALSLATVTALVAQPGPDSGPRGPRRGPGGPGGPGGVGLPPIFRALDADHNGEISSAEMANAPASLKALDLNDDGIFSAAELNSVRPARPADAATGAPPRGARPRPTLPLMLALDANADGIISAPEIANAVASLKALDANSDGMLTHDELRPLPPTGN